MYIKKLFDYSVPLVAAATVLVMGAVVVAGIAAYTTYDIKLASDSVEVTGSAKLPVRADTARWIINLETRTDVSDQEAGYARLETATDRIGEYLTEAGFTDFETPSISSYPNYSYPQNGEPVMTGYSVSRQIVVRSNEVERISEFANTIEPLTGDGYTATTQMLELTYSKLDEARVALLSAAIADATARAEAIASESSREVGMLRSASSGVVQVLPFGGIEVSDYGTYDTQSLEKEVMVTVRAEFSLN